MRFCYPNTKELAFVYFVLIFAVLLFSTEPVGSVAPKLNTDKINLINFRLGHTSNLLCQAQAFPTPVFRQVFFVTHILCKDCAYPIPHSHIHIEIFVVALNLVISLIWFQQNRWAVLLRKWIQEINSMLYQYHD